MCDVRVAISASLNRKRFIKPYSPRHLRARSSRTEVMNEGTIEAQKLERHNRGLACERQEPEGILPAKRVCLLDVLLLE